MTKAITPRLIHIWKRDVYGTEDEIGIGDVLFVTPYIPQPGSYWIKIYKYNPITKSLTELSIPTPAYLQSTSADIAHTRNKIWIYYSRPEVGYWNCYREYNVDFATGEITYSRDIGEKTKSDAGMSAIDDTTLITIVNDGPDENFQVFEVDITNHPLSYVLKFNIERHHSIWGDHLKTTTGKLLLIKGETFFELNTRFAIMQYDYATARLEAEIIFDITKNFNPYGIYQERNSLFVCGTTIGVANQSLIYRISLYYPYTLTLEDTLPINIYGASQIPEYLTKNLILPSSELINLGSLYNHYAACDPRGICREEWRVPSKSDFETLITYLGGESVAGGKMKQTGTFTWLTPNTGATNSSGFNAKASNYRLDDGTFADEHSEENFYAMFWTTTIETGQPVFLQLSYNSEEALLLPSSYAGEGGDDYRNNAASLRLVRNSTNLTHGQQSTYCGFNGIIYKTICIGTQEWLAENLSETEFWKGQLNYGTSLYNWHAVNDGRFITAADWHVATIAELTNLVTFLGGQTDAAPKVKSINNSLWTEYHVRTNNSKLTLHGAGCRMLFDTYAKFLDIKNSLYIWSSTNYSVNNAYYSRLDASGFYTVNYRFDKRAGFSVLIVKDFTLLSEGEEGTYIGNNGKVYETICINGKEWIKTGLNETLFRNLDPITECRTSIEWRTDETNPKRCYYEASPTSNFILKDAKDFVPNITDNTQWNALTTPARCAYKNNDSNILK